MLENINPGNTEKLNLLVSKLDSQDGFTPLMHNQIISIEKKLGFRLPGLFKELLIKTGLSDLNTRESDAGSIDLYRFCSNFYANKSIIPENLESISHFYQEPFDFPRQILPFGYSLSSMSPYCFDLSEMKDGDCPVYWYDFYVSNWATPGRVKNYFWSESMVSDYPEKIANSFEEFIMMYIEKRLWKL